ncbi:nucleoside kinase [Phascolarctobacterium faecium]|uniref:nucleoside kinase n=1 Tax=Phascolarctobacterium faecium TaxID=33025 RepID=UPI003AB1FEF3
MKIKLTLPNNIIREYPAGTTLLEVSRDFAANYQSPIVEGIFNGIGTDLQKPVFENGTVDFITLDMEEGMRVYVRSLLFLFLVAIKELRPEVKIEARNSLGSALFCEITNDIVLSNYDLKALEDYMKELAAKSEPIIYKHINKKEAEKILCERNEADRLELLHAIDDDLLLTCYTLKGHMEYFFGPMLPDCGYLKLFELINYETGIVINYPETGQNELDVFVDSPKLNKMFHEMEEWSTMLQCNTVAKLNRIIKEDHAGVIIQVAEALHEKKIAAIADEITDKGKDVHLVLIAGPSSSGKTTFAQRLSIQLVVNGLRPVPISMDDYYKERLNTPRKADGSYDFESVEAIDLELFNDHLKRLLAGETVKIPKYNFRTGLREYRGRELTLSDNSVLIVEGIHGLNERISAVVPARNKLKVYISALTPMSLDDYNRIQTTDMRLLRRLVRDSQFRSHDALMTLKLWDDVRRGEEKYIFPFQEEADIIFNTTLVYEFAVLKKYAEPLLQGVPETEAVYTNAQRLLGLLSHVIPLDKELIPKNSILREFVGGSAFKEAL